MKIYYINTTICPSTFKIKGKGTCLSLFSSSHLNYSSFNLSLSSSLSPRSGLTSQSINLFTSKYFINILSTNKIPLNIRYFSTSSNNYSYNLYIHGCYKILNNILNKPFIPGQTQLECEKALLDYVEK